MTDMYDEILEEIQKAKAMLRKTKQYLAQVTEEVQKAASMLDHGTDVLSKVETNNTNKFKHLVVPVKGSLDPGCPRCSCHRHCDDCDYDDLKNRELTPTEEEAVEWLFQLVETPVIIKEDK